MRGTAGEFGCVGVSSGLPYIERHDQNARFEVRLPADRRRELAELAARRGLSSADVVRLSTGGCWIIRASCWGRSGRLLASAAVCINPKSRE
jgi:hypothetical protein